MDKIFKVGLLVLGVVFLVLFYFHVHNGRYQVSTSSGNYLGGEGNASYILIVDTKKGTSYKISSDYIELISPFEESPTWQRTPISAKGRIEQERAEKERDEAHQKIIERYGFDPFVPSKAEDTTTE